jgi:hypothetical protein
MKAMFTAALLMGALSLNAQSAKVIQLSPEDAKQAKQLHDASEAAAKKESEFQDVIRERYLKASKEEEGHTQTYGYLFTFQGKEKSHGYWVKSGWGNGTFEFSEDFRFIVPVAGIGVNSISMSPTVPYSITPNSLVAY